MINLNCAVLAMLLLGWLRGYEQTTQGGDDPQKRALTRELMRRGLRKRLSLRWMVELLSILLHFSVYLFLVGFIIDLIPLNHFVATMTGACAGSGFLLYLYLSLAAIFSHNSPYYTPLTTLIWVILRGVISLFLCLHHFVALQYFKSDLEDAPRIRKLFWSYYWRMNDTTRVEKMADEDSPNLTASTFLWTFNSIDNDHDMDRFLSGIPGFYASARVHLGGDTLDRFNSDTFPRSIISFMDHILSPNLLPNSKKRNHIEICSRAMNADPLLLQSTFQWTLQTLSSNIFTCADFVHLALEQLRKNDSDRWIKDYAQCIVAIAINRTQLEDSAWIRITQDYLKPQHVQYLREGHNLQLCNLMYLAEHLAEHLKVSQLENSDQFECGGIWYKALFEARKLDVRDTAPELREEFCALWNELINVAKDGQLPQTTRVNAWLVISILSTVHDRLPVEILGTSPSF